MDFKFSKDSDNRQQAEAPDDKKKQSALLVLLLILVGGFTYIYFFTGLIKQQETVSAPPPVTTAKIEVAKLPLPGREGEAPKPEAKAAEKVAPVAAPTPVPPTSKSAATVVPPKQTAVVPSKPVAPQAKAVAVAKQALPKEEPKKAATKPSDKPATKGAVISKKAAVTAVPKVENKKAAPAAKKSAETDKKVTASKAGALKPVVPAETKADKGSKSKKTAVGSWSLNIGNYLLEEAISVDMGRIRKAGFQPVVKASPRKAASMNRLLVAEYPDRVSAQPTLDKLKKHTSDAFVIQQDGKYALIAGSYLQKEAAQNEADRLKAAGFAVIIKHIEIAIPSQTLSVGPFASKKAADAALAKLKSSGIKASISEK